jgi:hypothetical protein
MVEYWMGGGEQTLGNYCVLDRAVMVRFFWVTRYQRVHVWLPQYVGRIFKAGGG